jgi:hypothetical protein
MGWLFDNIQTPRFQLSCKRGNFGNTGEVVSISVRSPNPRKGGIFFHLTQFEGQSNDELTRDSN